MTATAVEQPDEPDTRDLSVIITSEGVVDVEGIPCRVRRLRARETLDLARIIGGGLGNALADFEFDFADIDQFKADVTALLMIALPNAEAETFAFLDRMLLPVDDKQVGRVHELMQNPDLGVAIDLLDLIVEQEGPSLVALLGKARALAGKVGNLMPKTPQETPSRPAGKHGRSRARST